MPTSSGPSESGIRVSLEDDGRGLDEKPVLEEVGMSARSGEMNKEVSRCTLYMIYMTPIFCFIGQKKDFWSQASMMPYLNI